MKARSSDFELTDIQRRESMSRETSTELFAPVTPSGGVMSARAKCVACGHAWLATKANGTLRDAIGGVRVRCPACAAAGTVRLEELT